MPHFSLNRNYILRSLSGRSVEFKKGVSTYIPDMMVKEAVAIGATPSDGSDPDVLEDEVVSKVPTDMATRRNDIMKAILDLVKKGDRTDFSAGNQPHPTAVSKLVGYSVQRPEIQTIWDAYCEEKAQDEIQTALDAHSALEASQASAKA